MQTVTRDYTYVLGQSNEEIARLIFQSSFLNELTRQTLLNAGIGPGMRVLDIGSGAGDVALLAADLVGPAGEVVGIDLNDRPLEIARARAAEAWLTNVSFVQGDLHEMAYDGEFDVVTGRLVLLHCPDPVEAVRIAARAARPGGVVMFQELNLIPGSVRAYPTHPLIEAMDYWFAETVKRAGLQGDAGYRLFDYFVQAGLPEPRLAFQSATGSGSTWEGGRWGAETLRAFLPAITATGVATAEEIDVDTLADRLRREVLTAGHVVKTPDCISAWARKP
ncbi:MAG TPA: class I SAM-dependent methyltransferase [Thermomicrobiales bacterium]|nr:class I SAM-dependent methyltransferase [Thermomicrobiales bacterium]